MIRVIKASEDLEQLIEDALYLKAAKFIRKYIN